ncbi:MAG: flagellar hook-basal body complex protein [Clostridiales bacterium]|nr:flagellar hook-basal body complex protein [Clostridiales bacterium]
MLRAMDSAVAGLRAHQNKLDVISNNIANVNTFGYKSMVYSFKEAMYQTSTNSTGGIAGGEGESSSAGTNGAQYGFGTMMGSISMDMSASTPSYVGGLNASINGNGFFITSPVATQDTELGEDAAENTEAIKKNGYSYTRVGKFQLDSQGYLTDGTNFVYGFKPTEGGEFDTENLTALRCVDEEGNPVQALSVKISEVGEIIVQVKDKEGNSKEMSLGKVAVATFQNQEGLMKSGGNYFTASPGDNTGLLSASLAGGAAPKLMTGYLEASNVDLAREFAEMITTQRGFQANSKIITVSDEILADLINMKR